MERNKCSNDCEKACVPFFAHENVLMHYNRANKRMLIALIVSLCIVFVGMFSLGCVFLSSYNEREKLGEPDFRNLKQVGVAYTTTEDEKHELQVNVDLEGKRLEYLMDDVVVKVEDYGDKPDDYFAELLEYLDFDGLIAEF